MNENWVKVRVLQYLLFKADNLDQKAKEATQKLQRTKKLSDVEFMQLYNDLHNAEFFDIIMKELIGFL